MHDFVIIGGGILGLATALQLSRAYPEARILVLEKESSWAAHQSGRNSGVIHSGIYYRPGSRKARLAVAGSRAMVEFCQQHRIDHELCGKLIVASDARELPLLERLYRRGRANGVTVAKLSGEAAREIEPHVACVAALHVPAAGIVDYRDVCAKYAELLAQRGATLRLNACVRSIRRVRRRYRIATADETYEAAVIVNCAGLHSDRVARLAGSEPPARIVPFRGEYYGVRPQAAGLVRGLIYPVPNPAFPFLGVHLTRTISGDVHAGPNAVLALKREGYRRRDVSLRDAAELAGSRALWRLARKHAGEGAREALRSLSKRRFVRSVQRLVPEIGPDDLIPGSAGVRAQAVAPTGELVDDFLIVRNESSVHVCNAPSPGATASLEIGRAVAALVPRPAALQASAMGTVGR